MNRLLRRVAMPALKLFAIDLPIPHPWVKGQKIRLNAFRHKGYWYHGRAREEKSMELFARLIGTGMTVAEVGGHIGYITQYFSHLVGPSGKVVVFEPGSNNLPYIRSNTVRLGNVTLLEKGAGAEPGMATFFEESLTGQNNSFVEDFKGLEENAEVAFVNVEKKRRDVEIVTLDSLFSERPPDFIKIDVEGFEFQVLRGARDIIKRGKTAMMVEVQADRPEIWSLLTGAGYVLFSAELEVFKRAEDLISNVFALHGSHHKDKLAQLGLAK